MHTISRRIEIAFVPSTTTGTTRFSHHKPSKRSQQANHPEGDESSYQCLHKSWFFSPGHSRLRRQDSYVTNYHLEFVETHLLTGSLIFDIGLGHGRHPNLHEVKTKRILLATVDIIVYAET
jgi:hypothetical protein